MKKEMNLDDVKKFIFYGEENEKRLDMAFFLMFDYLENETNINRKSVEELFWDRILQLANRNIDLKK